MTGLASFGDQLISIESHSDKLAFYDLRKPSALIFVCNLDKDFYNSENTEQSARASQIKQGNSSLHIEGSKLTMTTMSNTVLIFDLQTITDRSCPPKVLTGIQSTFYAKGSSRGSRVACGS